MAFNLTNFLLTAGYIGLFIGVFAETGFFIGVILPGGETLVFTAGLLAALGYFNVWAVIVITFVASVLADNLEYAFGRKYGSRIFSKDRSLFFDKAYVEETREFYGRHGGKTIILARFLPFIRTFAPAFAGVGEMPYPIFLVYNVAGGALWAVVVTLVGYYLGKAIPNADQYSIAIIIAIVVASLGFSLLLGWQHWRRQKSRADKG